METRLPLLIWIFLISGAVTANAEIVSNSMIVDDIEYYMQADDSIYDLGENVEMLYRITNLREEQVTFSFTNSPEWNFWVEKDGENIWTAVEGWWLICSGFTLAPSESIEFPTLDPYQIWDMRDSEDNLVSPGQYDVIGGLDGGTSISTKEYEFTEVSVSIEVVLGSVSAVTRYVPDEYPTIQAAIDSSVYGDTVQVSAGTYFENIILANGVRLIGEVVGADPNNTIMDANNNGSVVTSLGCDPNTVLEGFTFINGTGTENMLMESNGGGMFCWNSSPIIRNCTFSANVAGLGRGGGIYCAGSSPKLINCTFIANSASDGGGMFCGWESNPELVNCTFIANYAQNGGGMNIYYNSRPTLINCTFSENSARGCGGGVHCSSESNPKLVNCTFRTNSAKPPSSPYSHHNTGGGMFCHFSNPSVVNCIFTDNSAYSGGGIYSSRSGPTVSICTFSGNQAIRGNTLACNSSNQNYPSTVELSNCILWNGVDQIWNNDGSTFTITYSDVIGGWEGEGNIDEDPLFVDPNGPDGDYHLQFGSPCIDVGDNSVVDANIPDLDGNPRIINGIVDMGAYEALLPIEADVHIVPRVINRNNRMKRVMAIIRLPQGISKQEIADEPFVLHVDSSRTDGIEATWQRVIGWGRRASVFTLFDKAELMDAVPNNGRVELTIVGKLESGQYIYGSDVVRVIEPRRRRRRWRR